MWLFFRCEADELFGALLRASYCHDARLIILAAADDMVRDSWICDYAPVTVAPEISLVQPHVLWRGGVWQVIYLCYRQCASCGAMHLNWIEYD